MAGRSNLWEFDAEEQTREVRRVFVHPKFNDQTWENDIAILVLNESYRLNDYVRPVPVGDPTWELPGMNNRKCSDIFEILSHGPTTASQKVGPM